MLSKCVGNVVNTAIRYNLCIFRAFKPLQATEFKQIKNVYQFSRQFNSQKSRSKTETQVKGDDSAESIAYYSMAVVILCGGLSFAAVPLYRLFCQVICAIIYYLWFFAQRKFDLNLQATGYGGTVNENHDAKKVENMKRVGNRIIKIQFNADTAASMRWNFKPQQYELRVNFDQSQFCFIENKP